MEKTTIDLTPSWQETAKVLRMLYLNTKNESGEAIREADKVLMQMAEICEAIRTAAPNVTINELFKQK